MAAHIERGVVRAAVTPVRLSCGVARISVVHKLLLGVDGGGGDLAVGLDGAAV